MKPSRVDPRSSTDQTDTGVAGRRSSTDSGHALQFSFSRAASQTPPRPLALNDRGLTARDTDRFSSLSIRTKPPTEATTAMSRRSSFESDQHNARPARRSADRSLPRLSHDGHNSPLMNPSSIDQWQRAYKQECQAHRADSYQKTRRARFTFDFDTHPNLPID